MNIALSGTELSADDGVEPLADTCDRLGLHWVELWYPRNTDALGLEQSLDRLAESGISVACVGTATELGGDGDVSAAQRTIVDAVELAARIGCGLVNTYFGWRSERDDTRAAKAYRANLAPCLRAAERSGVTITLENEFDAFGHDSLGTDVSRRPDALIRLMETVGSEHFRVAFDPCNAYFAGVNPRQMYERIAPYVAYVHLKDGIALGGGTAAMAGWQRFVDHGREYMTCPLGMGEVGWDGLLAQLTDRGYDGFLTLEPHSERNQLQDAWQQAAEFVRRLTGTGVA